MKILLIQEAARKHAIKKYRECESLKNALMARECSVEIWGLNQPNFTAPPDFEAFDLIINCENYDQSGWVPSFRHIQRPKKFLWVIDAHIHGKEAHETLFHNGGYDLILQANRTFVNPKTSVWFPNCVDPNLMRPIPTVEKHAFFGFVGTPISRRRRSWLSSLSRSCFLRLYHDVLGDEMVQLVNSFYIHFNLNLKDDINYRSFETIACGTVLMTNHNPQYEDLGFRHKENCLMYRSKKDVRALIRHYSQNITDLKQIAENGYELSKKHTYDARVNLLLDAYRGLSEKPSPHTSHLLGETNPWKASIDSI